MRARLSGSASAPTWFCLGLGLFLMVRAVSTLLLGASFAQPGDGWRSLWQLGVMTICAVGVMRPQLTRTAVVIVGAMYAVATVLELANGTVLLGTIPVDMRDRIVHPAIALIAFGVLALDRHGSRSVRPAV